MTDRWDDFDCSLATSLSELPPSEETVREVTPFRAAMGKAIWGLCLTSFTLEFWYLPYLLPALGSILMVLGFRSLRNNNRWFQFCWILSIYQAIYLYSIDVLSATPLTAETAQISLWVPGVATVGAAALRYFCLWMGLAQAAAEVGQPRRAAAPALWALGWYGALILLGVLWPQPGWVIGLIMIIAFVCIVRSLLRQGRDTAALAHYEKATDLLYRNLGVRPSEELRALYIEIMSTEKTLETDLGVIMGDLKEAASRPGAFVCEYGFFKEAYRLEARRAIRSGACVHLCLITVSLPDGGVPPLKVLSATMDQLQEVLVRNLRRGDVVSKFSGAQFVILLPAANFEDSNMVMDRVVNAFYQQHRRNFLKLTVRVREIELN